MKKSVTLLFVFLAIVSTASAQKALGLRLGSGSASGVEASFQLDLSKANRLELDLGLESGEVNHSGMTLIGDYQWVWDLSELSEGFKWYAGAGAGLHIFDNIGIGVNGQLGIEYTLQEIPLQFSLDTRPSFFGSGYGFGYGAALGVRYKF